MKHKTLFPRAIPVLASLLLTMLCAIGCTQEDPSEFPGTNPNDSDKPIPVTIAFNGVETMFGPYGAETRNLQANKIHFSQEYDKTRMIETIVMADPDTLQVPLDPSTRGSLASTTLRIVAYDATNTEYKGTGVFDIDKDGKVTPNSDETLTLKQGNYIFHCFSPAGPITVSDDKTTVTVNLPPVEGTVDPKSYYAKADAKVAPPTNEGTSNVTIPPLKPQYCKLTLEVTAPEGKTVTYESAELTTTLYKEASLALPGGTVSSANSSPSETTIDSKSPTIYTYPGATGKFKIILTTVEVDGVPKEIAPLISAAGLTMSAGNAYKANVKLEKKKNWIKVDAFPFKIAMGNLIGPVTGGGALNKNKDTLPIGDWSIGPDQGWSSGSSNGGDYFNWGVRDPLCAGGSSVNVYYDTKGSCPWGPISGIGDKYKNQLDSDANPCFLAIGRGWHVPTPDETAEMAKSSRQGKYNSPSKGPNIEGQYFGTTRPVSASDKDTYVFLPVTGLRDYSSAPVVVNPSYGYYWSSGPHSSSYNAYNMRFNGGNVNGGTSNSNYRFGGMAIRCVSY